MLLKKSTLDKIFIFTTGLFMGALADGRKKK